MSKNKIVTSALILTFAGIITRILGFIYRIYMSNVIGAEGIGLYQLITPLYSLVWSISCSGFTTTISKLVAAERAKGEYGNMGRILKQCIVITGTIGIILSLCFFIFADIIALDFIKDERTILSLKILAFGIPFMAAGSCVRGYFFGLQESIIPAISQVFEQCTRMVVIFFLSSTLIPMGLSYAAAAAVIGIVIGEFSSFLYVIISYKRFKEKNVLTKKPSFSSSKSLSIILAMAIPLTLNRVTGSLLMTFENILIPQRLQLYGASAKDAMITYGQITGMAMPLIFFPTAILIALSISLVPAVSEDIAVKNYKKINYTVQKSLLFTSIIGIGSACLFIVFNNELGIIIYKQNIGQILLYLGIMCPFIYLQVVLSGLLNGLGQQMFIFRNSLISSVINLAFIYFLVPNYGVNAFMSGWFISLILVCILDLEKLKSSISLEIKLSKWFLLPTMSALGSGLVLNLLSKKYLMLHFGDILGLILSIVTLLGIYMFFVVLSGCISMKDISSILGIKARK